MAWSLEVVPDADSYIARLSMMIFQPKSINVRKLLANPIAEKRSMVITANLGLNQMGGH
jgi:hypothetical protein